MDAPFQLRVLRRKPLVFLVAGLALILVLLAALAYAFPQQVLCIESGPTQADAIVLLGGGSSERPERAAELFREHAAPKIIVTGVGDWTKNQRLLLKAGVPADAIEVDSKAKSTRQNARFTIPMLRAMGARRVIIVTTWYHSRRSLKCFRHYAPDLQFYARPSYFGFERSLWSRAGVKYYIRTEYPKFLFYWVCYGVCPF